MVSKHEIKIETVSIPVKDSMSLMTGYLARPASDEIVPGVIVGMEIFGVNNHIKEITNRIAELGYAAIAIDFYHRSEPSIELSYDTEGRNKGMLLMHQLCKKGVLNDIEATMNFFKSCEAISGNIGFIGFSIGGHIGYLAATQFNLALAICFYGGWIVNTDIKLSQPEPTLKLSSGIAENNGQLYYFVGGQDSLITREQIDLIERTLITEKVKHEITIYPEAKHGFFASKGH